MRTKPLALLVDDEEVFLEIASVRLNAAGFETIFATNFHDAIEKAENYQPDIVITDIYMPPNPSGWELASALRENPKTRNIKIAFFSSLRDPWLDVKKMEKKKILRELGNVTFLNKIDGAENISTDVAALLQKS